MKKKTASQPFPTLPKGYAEKTQKAQNLFVARVNKYVSETPIEDLDVVLYFLCRVNVFIANRLSTEFYVEPRERLKQKRLDRLRARGVK